LAVWRSAVQACILVRPQVYVAAVRAVAHSMAVAGLLAVVALAARCGSVRPEPARPPTRLGRSGPSKLDAELAGAGQQVAAAWGLGAGAERAGLGSEA
jgi:hypothetical protein